ncbi:MAG: TatD family hydrolase [Alphaproteobacteria bacterium]|nr:TatD family hydrolase [Alphaproteobacteria bacterium]
MFIDTHCHLTDDYEKGIDTVIKEAHDVNVGVMICATADPADIKPALEIAQKYKNIFVTTGIHPDYTDSNPTQYLTEEILNNPFVIGIGEIGLDYHYNPQTRVKQIELFEKQLEIALKHNLPVAIHTREAEEDTASILTDKFQGVMHCFTSSWNLAKIMLDRGFYFSASGILTFKNADSIRETFLKIPNDRIVIETDSPYCAPVPYRGKQCTPSMVIETAKVLAQIKNLQIAELETILFENTKRLYPKCHVKL